MRSVNLIRSRLKRKSCAIRRWPRVKGTILWENVGTAHVNQPGSAVAEPRQTPGGV